MMGPSYSVTIPTILVYRPSLKVTSIESSPSLLLLLDCCVFFRSRGGLEQYRRDDVVQTIQ